jgi:hypothetical protein
VEPFHTTSRREARTEKISTRPQHARPMTRSVVAEVRAR